MVDPHPRQPAIDRQRIRVPQQNKSALHLPPLNQAPRRLDANRDHIKSQAATPLKISFFNENPTLGQLQSRARNELIESALSYSNQYLPHRQSIDLADQPIVMSGHQPVLYHAGVWYKNFVLSELADRANGIAVNLIVDSDLSNHHTIRCPDLASEPVHTQTIAIDKPDAVMPHEQRSIQDSSFFFETANRIHQIAFANEPCIAQRLWPEVNQAYTELSKSTPAPMLGATIAAGRHRFEQNIGLRTLEVPVSKLCQTTTFATFAAAVFDRATEFLNCYNQVLLEYRHVNRIRSSSHPVPALEQIDGWTEVPFWISSDQIPERQRLFIRNLPESFELSDRKQLCQTIPKADFISAFKQLKTLGITIRSRAISTTMFCRLFMSDIFIHGVGGAKYDQLTDAICQTFFGCRLPKHLTVSATFCLPTQVPKLSQADITQLRTRRREYNFHPERFLASNSLPSQAVELIKQKRQWIDSPDIWSLEKHLAITKINQALRALLKPSDDELGKEIESLTAQLRSSEIANSREYSFCLFGESLVDDLKRLTKKNFAV